MGMLRYLLRRSLATKHRFHSNRLRQIRPLLRYPHLLRYLLWILYNRIRTTPDPECCPQRRLGTRHDHRSTDRSSEPAQYCAIHFWWFHQFDRLAIWFCFYPKLFGSGLDYL